MLDLRFCRMRIGLEQRLCREDLSRRADPALQSAMRQKCFLERMKPVALGNAFDRRDRAAVGMDGESEAGTDRLAVEQHGASAAHTDTAALFRARQLLVFAQELDKKAIVLN